LGLPLGCDGKLVDGLLSLSLLEPSQVPGSAMDARKSAREDHAHCQQHRGDVVADLG
jgi:hypothetical protein